MMKLGEVLKEAKKKNNNLWVCWNSTAVADVKFPTVNLTRGKIKTKKALNQHAKVFQRECRFLQAFLAVIIPILMTKNLFWNYYTRNSSRTGSQN